jgi:hypothetical protein
MEKQKGGARSHTPNNSGGLYKIDHRKSGFRPVYDMLNSPSSSLGLVTYNSLKGFILRLEVDKVDSEYKVRGESENATSFILKFVVITKYPDEALVDFKRVNKASESRDTFFSEAKMQTDILTRSIVGRHPGICPSVANLSLFNNQNSKRLLTFLEETFVGAKSSPAVNDIFEYLMGVIDGNPTYELGVLLMANVTNSETFGSFISSASPDDLTSALVETIVNILRLFLVSHAVHFDLHEGNVLIYKKYGHVKSKLIDFGSASLFNNREADPFLSVVAKTQILRIRDNYFNEMFETHSDPDKIDFVKRLFGDVYKIAQDVNQVVFDYRNSRGSLNPDDCQMDWIERYTITDKMWLNIFNRLYTNMTGSEVRSSATSLRRHEDLGETPNFRKNISHFYVNFALLHSCMSSEDSPGRGCSLMGGKPTRGKKSKRIPKKGTIKLR